MYIKKLSVIFVLILSLFVFGTRERAYAGWSEETKVMRATEVLDEIMSIPEKRIPPTLLKNAHGIAIIPGVIKVGLIVAGRRGKGILMVRMSDGTWSDPVFIDFISGSVGWQIGAQSTDIILVFKGIKSVDSIRKGKYTLGVDAGVAAGPVGRYAGASTDIQLQAEIYSYSKSRGLFAGVAIEGATLQIDDSANADFYNNKTATPLDIFANKISPVPTVADQLHKVLGKYTLN